MKDRAGLYFSLRQQSEIAEVMGMQASKTTEIPAVRDANGAVYAPWLQQILQDLETHQQTQREVRRMRLPAPRQEPYGYD